MGQVLDRLGLKRTGGNYRHITQRIRAYSIDTSHFLGKGWARGLTQETSDSVALSARFNRLPDSEVFKLGSTYQLSKLRSRLLQLGLEYVCAECGISTWREQPLTLHVDHINGNTSDARLENLRFLCPNCHQQTRTWGSKKSAGVAERSTRQF
ncbi:MAG: HNH endonuclease signature motif containing protein [Bacteroidota bacterium]